ncbi:MAG: hypothetical protein IID41_15130 [Planctomycetes bacterium]|nr:hypothetical protein [Planctomycetota bacterium]
MADELPTAGDKYYVPNGGEEIAERLLALTVRDPAGREIHPFEAVHKPEILYNCDRSQYEWLPDLMLVPQPGLAVVRKIRGGKPVIWSSFSRLEGTHRMEGIFAAAGNHIRPTTTIKANMADIAPTLLASLGLPIPSDMEGRVLTDIFTNPPTVQSEDVHDNAGQGDDQTDESQVYNEREQAILTERLADLGYLE